MWKTVKLGEVCEIQPKKEQVKQKLADSDDVSFMPMEDLGINDMYPTTNQTKTLARAYSPYTYFEDNDVLLAKITPCFENGKIGIATNLTNGVGFGSSEYIVLRCCEEVIPQYIYYNLNQPSFRTEGKKHMSGAVGHKRVPKEFVENLKIPLPPLAEQQRIVAKLDAAFAEIDVAIAVAESKQTEVEKLKASLLAQVLSGPEQGGEAWETVTLGDVCELAYGKALDKKDRLESGGYPAFGANGIKTQAKAPLYDKPSIIIGRKGSAGEINKVTEPFWALDVTYYTKINENIIALEYLFYVLLTLNLPSLAKGVKPGINRNDAYKQAISLPPLAEQQRIVAKLDAAFAEIDKAKESVSETKAHYQALKSAILAKELQPPQSEAA